MAWASQGPKGAYRGRYRDAERNVQDVRDREGSVRWFASKKAAREAALDEESKIRQGTWWDPAKGAITFADYFETHWLPNKVVEVTTIVKYEAQYGCKKTGLKAYWGEVELRHITPTSVQT
ncbi:MAG TPA: hypothetical protein VK204_19020, partial [Nocardioidaceae bacterium]|nr:hypothetical protein [Nocardioidaceae bacterium]